MTVRGVILAGGKGTRLGELTRATNKHLLPVGAWPMVCHPLRKLVEAGVRDVLLVTGPEHLGSFAALLGSGRRYDCRLSYRVQEEPGGIAQALALAEDFCRGAHALALLGDNVFLDPLHDLLADAAGRPDHAWVLLRRVPDPQRYGVAVVRGGKIVGIEEKPRAPESDLAVVGVYLYPPDVFSIIRTLRPGRRGELEITDVNRDYLARGRLSHRELAGPWADAGTPASLEAAGRLALGGLSCPGPAASA
jgi:glucose-1-phosphate thymidylyltransferase